MAPAAEISTEAQRANETAKRELAAALQKKKQVDKQLAAIEQRIYSFEETYLAESSLVGGNIVKGFDGYLKPPTSGGAHKRKAEVTEPERLFSGSSLTYAKSLELNQSYSR